MRSGEYAALILADPPDAPYADGLSLMHGWLPVGAQIVSAVVALAVARRSRRWWLV
jgi:hypothetical protein